jgi:2-polyprenyl-3-methyl-5-hydroxy-6-metoxy-1,4-benzoquinol methylase
MTLSEAAPPVTDPRREPPEPNQRPAETPDCSPLVAAFGDYLHRRLHPSRAAAVRRHLDTCPNCWTTWNRYRWDAARLSPLLSDLVTYLGPQFIDYYDSSQRLAVEWDHAAPTTPAAVQHFYAQTDSYLYNQVVWHASGNRPPYLHHARSLLQVYGSHTIMDYGCGIGADTLALHADGFTVIACDLDGPPTRFLRWRQDRLGDTSPVHTPEHLPATPEADTLWIIDTLDHLPDLAVLTPILSHARLVITENLADDRGHGRQSFHIRRPAAQIARVFAAHGLRPAPGHPTADSINAWVRPG